MADIVAKRFLASERETLIQDQALTRNVDSQIHSHRFDCCVFQFYIPSAATFATISAIGRHMQRSKMRPYSITSSASDIRLSEILRPSVFAVLRLMTTSNLVGSWTGRSAGFAPLRIRSIYDAARRKRSAVLLPKDSKPPLSAK